MPKHAKPSLDDRLSVEWWSDSTGSVQYDGIDVVNVTIERRQFCCSEDGASPDPGLTRENYQHIEEQIVQALFNHFGQTQFSFLDLSDVELADLDGEVA